MVQTNWAVLHNMLIRPNTGVFLVSRAALFSGWWTNDSFLVLRMSANTKWRYHSFKIFLRFWLAKITRIIHHNQLLLTKFGRILPYWTDDVKSAVNLQIIEPLTEKTLRRGWVVFEVSNGGTLYSFHGKLLSKNITRTARRQLDRRHLLFGVYLQNWTALYLLNFLIKMHYRCDFKLNIDGGKQVQETLHIAEHIGTIRRNKH